MPTVTIVAPLTDTEGLACWGWTGESGRFYPEQYAAHPADSFDDHQPPDIEVRIGHAGPVIGRLIHLDHRHRTLDAVAVIDVHDDEVDNLGALYFSAGIVEYTPTGSVVAQRCVLDHLAIVANTAGIGLRPLTVVPGDLRDAGARMLWHHQTPRLQLLRRAADAWGHRHRGDPIVIDRGEEHRDGGSQPPPGSGSLEYSGHRGRVIDVY